VLFTKANIQGGYMEQNKFGPGQQGQKKTEMPERKREDISGGPRTTVRPEIDLPLKGGRSESDLASKTPGSTPARQDERSERSDRAGSEKVSR
jgi:hypothetical protein